MLKIVADDGSGSLSTRGVPQLEREALSRVGDRPKVEVNADCGGLKIGELSVEIAGKDGRLTPYAGPHDHYLVGRQRGFNLVIH
jgi:hypothetical protein